MNEIEKVQQNLPVEGNQPSQVTNNIYTAPNSTTIAANYGAIQGVDQETVNKIFGEIEDEHDSNDYIATKIDEHEYMLSARLEIARANDLFDLDLPESEAYMTIGGLILHEYQSFPKLNEVVTIGRFEFKIVKNTMTKIEVVRLKVNP